MFGRKKIAMLVAEFLGTGVLTLVVLAVQRSTIGIPYFVSIAAGLAVGALALVLAGASGAHFNPAITLGAWSARKVKTLPAISYIVSQLLGGWAAYGIYTYFVNSSFAPIGGHYTTRLLIAEAVGTFIFAFGWAAVAAQKLSAGLTGAAFTLGILIASIASVGLLNPALAVGTRAWAVFGTMGWGTYLLGPLVGAVVGFNVYDVLFGGRTTLLAATARTTTTSSTPVASTTSARVAKKPAAKKTAAKKK